MTWTIKYRPQGIGPWGHIGKYTSLALATEARDRLRAAGREAYVVRADR